MPKTQDYVQGSYEVSYEPQSDQALLNLPDQVRKELDELYEQISSQPKKTIPRLLQLQELYPKVMLINNYLSIAYGYFDADMQKQCIKDNYQKNPNYLFARCHYAQLCLDDGNISEIPQIFNHKYDLKALYPRRNRFHIGEYLAFMLVMCLYFNALGERKQADTIYDNMRQAAPQADEVKQAKRELYPNFLQRCAQRIKSILSDK